MMNKSQQKAMAWQTAVFHAAKTKAHVKMTKEKVIAMTEERTRRIKIAADAAAEIVSVEKGVLLSAWEAKKAEHIEAAAIAVHIKASRVAVTAAQEAAILAAESGVSEETKAHYEVEAARAVESQEPSCIDEGSE